MERYLRFYIKFQSYVIAVATILASIFMTTMTLRHSNYYYPLEEFYDYRFMGNGALIFGVIWFAVGVSLFYGIFKEVKKYAYPFIAMFMFDLFLLVLRDIILIWQNKRFYEMVFVDPPVAIITLYVVLHVTMTLVALGKLIDHEPPPQSGSNFVRFKTTDSVRQRSGAVDGDEEALVTE